LLFFFKVIANVHWQTCGTELTKEQFKGSYKRTCEEVSYVNFLYYCSQCCGSEIINFGSGSGRANNYGSILIRDLNPKVVERKLLIPDPYVQIITDPAGAGSTTLIAEGGEGVVKIKNLLSIFKMIFLGLKIPTF
jgi:hypothetical protein